MKSRIIGKLVSLITVCMLLAGAMHSYQTSRSQMGREEYLAKQAQRFDKHYARPDPYSFDLFGCLILAIPTFVMYEGIAWGVARTLKRIDQPGNS